MKRQPTLTLGAMAAALGALGGSSKSAAKVAASRENAKTATLYRKTNKTAFDLECIAKAKSKRERKALAKLNRK